MSSVLNSPLPRRQTLRSRGPSSRSRSPVSFRTPSTPTSSPTKVETKTQNEKCTHTCESGLYVHVGCTGPVKQFQRKRGRRPIYLCETCLSEQEPKDFPQEWEETKVCCEKGTGEEEEKEEPKTKEEQTPSRIKKEKPVLTRRAKCTHVCEDADETSDCTGEVRRFEREEFGDTVDLCESCASDHEDIDHGWDEAKPCCEDGAKKETREMTPKKKAVRV